MNVYVYWPGQAVVTTAGEDTTWYVQVRDGTGRPVNISGWTFLFTAVNQHDGDDTVSTTSFSIVDAEEGIASFTLSRSTTLDLGGKVFRGEIWRTTPDKMLATGDWKVMRSIRA